ncbi:Poly(A) polymerase central domain-containing protein [Mycena rosella]|uniref:polynucleotide adenylyltransferase n=1 Tax=Mycena rosella TaxID=1033263 RepID=A0AAD7B8U4_MYCRO|nr:Poly(A) polymerase central domain-containing protein [Mycena rosella]
MSGIPLNLSTARLALPEIPDDLSLRNVNLLRDLDERCVRSLGGPRTMDEILRLVPNVQVFRDSLRCVALWACRKAIYSNITGFLGGPAWAILVARVCQLYPNAIAGAIAHRFFIIMSWPQPVLLKPIEEGPLQVRAWNPMVTRGFYPLCVHPLMRLPSSTPPIGPIECRLSRLQEFKKAADVCDKVVVGKAAWSDLFSKHDFFHKYRYYLQVIASTGKRAPADQVGGTCGVSDPHLVMNLDGRKATSEGKAGGGVVYSTTFYIGLLIEPKRNGAGPQRLDISYPVREFTTRVRAWEEFDELSMSIVVQHIKSSALPDYVYDGAEWPQKLA